MEAGHGIERTVLMYNDFILVGPAADPAGVNGLSSAAQAFQQIAVNGSYFASRGDQSGTYAAEQRIWAQAGLHPDPEESWYLSLGQGMGATLQFADERGAYTLSDRGTYLASTENLDDLIVMVGGASFYENIDDLLMNCYSVIAVNPSEFPGVDYDLARSFTMWISDPETKARIARFGIERFGQPLFYPVEADGSKPIQSPGQQAP